MSLQALGRLAEIVSKHACTIAPLKLQEDVLCISIFCPQVRTQRFKRTAWASSRAQRARGSAFAGMSQQVTDDEASGLQLRAMLLPIMLAQCTPNGWQVPQGEAIGIQHLAHRIE